MAEFQGIFRRPFLPSVLIIERVGGLGGGVGWDGKGGWVVWVAGWVGRVRGGVGGVGGGKN